jgi:hypothetical protein
MSADWQLLCVILLLDKESVETVFTVAASVAALGKNAALATPIQDATSTHPEAVADIARWVLGRLVGHG